MVEPLAGGMTVGATVGCHPAKSCPSRVGWMMVGVSAPAARSS